MSLNPVPSGDSHNWNYSRPDDAGFALELIGTVAAIQEVQANEFSADGRPTGPAFWPDGNPKMNIRLVLVGPKGGYRTWTITPAGKEAKQGLKPHVHIDLYKLAIAGGGDQFTQLIGKTIKVTTVAPPPGFGYGRNNPRPWTVEDVSATAPGAPYAPDPANPIDPIYLLPKVYHNTSVSGGTMNPAMATGAAAAADPAAAHAAAAAAAAAPGSPVVEGDDLPF
jgi:hypothetical protein